MISVTPQGIIKLCKVPLESDLKNQITFSNSEAQYNYFNSCAITGIPESDYTYIRKDGTIKIAVPIDEIIDCNYLFYNNKGFTNKKYYCFITDMQYLNENCTIISIKTDVFQTWQFEISYKACFTEREHVNDDTIGKHTIPEGLETGPYYSTAETSIVSSLGVGVFLSENFLAGSLIGSYVRDPGRYGGMVIPCYSMLLSLSDAPSVIKDMADYAAQVGKADAIISIFTYPTNFQNGSEQQMILQTLNIATRTLSASVKNNKCFTAPYCYAVVEAPGQAITLDYDLFSGTRNISIRGVWGPTSEVIANINNYVGNYEYMLSISGFPLMAWINNSYQNWLAQNKASLALSFISSAASLTAGAIGTMINPAAGAGGIIGGVYGIANTLTKIYDHKTTPDSMNGSVNAAATLSWTGQIGFRTYCRTIRSEYLKVIDDYFTMYGYKVNSLKIPNITGRKYWNFVKTIDCNFEGNIPSSDLESIRNMFNAGVTLWHDTDHLYDYTLNNIIL